MLAWTIYLSFAAAGVMICIPRERLGLARWTALGFSLAMLVVGMAGAVQISPGETTTLARVPWIPALGISFHLAADGISATLVVLTGIAAVAGVLLSWNVEKRVTGFFAFYFLLLGGVFGVFLSFDLFLLFVFYEIAIIPKYFLIAIWGSTRSEYGAMKLALYSFVGSALVLIGLLAVVAISGSSFDLFDLAAARVDPISQRWLFPLTFVGFAILAGLWPFHTWAPTGHVAAPTAASMLLAGVVMKLGGYGALRVSMTLFPQGLRVWQELFAALALVGIIYGAAVALTQTDFKFVIGYSSVSHMGFVLLGLMSMTALGLAGAVVQMFSHGIIAALLFAIVGRIIYDRTHTREFALLQGFTLGKQIPFAAVLFFVAALASMGFPGFSGFIAEVSILIGAWQTLPVITILAGVGILLVIAFTWRAARQSFFQDSTIPTPITEKLPPITLPEKLGTLLLLACTLAVGLYPRLLFDLITPALAQPLFQPIFAR